MNLRAYHPVLWLALAACAPTRARGLGVLVTTPAGFADAPPARAESPERTHAYGRPRFVLEATVARVTRDAIDLDVALSAADDVHATSTSWYIDLIDDAHHRASEPDIVRESHARDVPRPYLRRCPSTDHTLQHMPGGEFLEPPPGNASGVCREAEHYFTRASRLRFRRGELLQPGARSLSLVLTDATVRLAIRWSITQVTP